MNHVMYGLPKEAHDFLAEKRALPGDRCWCCGLPLPDEWPAIETVQRENYSFQLHRYMLREAGWVAEEYLQAETVANNTTYYYLALKVKPDGVLAHGDGNTIQWPETIVFKVFPDVK